jgi:signal transduction histidine kinase
LLEQRVAKRTAELNQTVGHLKQTQIHGNILINAIDAIEEHVQKWQETEASQNSTMVPTIRIQTATITPECVEIRVADNGPSITAAVQAQLFNPFFTTKPVGKGTGIGLAISHSIVTEKHGGSYAVGLSLEEAQNL